MKNTVPDTVWPSDNNLGIPTLALSMQADAIDLPFRGWGTITRRSAMRGTWHFYVDDYRFSALWKDPSKVPDTNCITAVEPNWTVTEQLPLAVVQYRIYQKRWMARYWQSKGVRVLVDMNVHPRLVEENLVGVPQGWKAFSTRGYKTDLSYINDQVSIARQIAGTNDILFVVYGGGLKVKEFAQDKNIIWLPEQQDERRDSRYLPVLGPGVRQL
jgi:hypothetical protein